MVRRLTVLIDSEPANRFHRATLTALRHAIDASGIPDTTIDVTHTDEIGVLGDGVVIGPGSPYRDARAAEHVVHTAREQGIPLVGT